MNLFGNDNPMNRYHRPIQALRRLGMMHRPPTPGGTPISQGNHPPPTFLGPPIQVPPGNVPLIPAPGPTITPMGGTGIPGGSGATPGMTSGFPGYGLPVNPLDNSGGGGSNNILGGGSGGPSGGSPTDLGGIMFQSGGGVPGYSGAAGPILPPPPLPPHPGFGPGQGPGGIMSTLLGSQTPGGPYSTMTPPSPLGFGPGGGPGGLMTTLPPGGDKPDSDFPPAPSNDFPNGPLVPAYRLPGPPNPSGEEPLPTPIGLSTGGVVGGATQKARFPSGFFDWIHSLRSGQNIDPNKVRSQLETFRSSPDWPTNRNG